MPDCRAYKMGRSSDALRGDLRAIHSALGEVLNCTQPQVPSWRFPEKLSTLVTLDDMLGEPEGCDDVSARACLLEGIVDRYDQLSSQQMCNSPHPLSLCRLLLLLQGSLKLWNEADGHPSHPLPLSLSSAVKKYCRKLVQKTKHVQGLQQLVR